MLKKRVEDDIKSGVVKPLPNTVFSTDQLENAFQSMVDGNHVGKVLVQMRDNENSVGILPTNIEHKIYFVGNSTYIVAGIQEDITLELVDWMIERCARKILLNLPKVVQDDFLEVRMRIWKAKGCHIVINESNTATREGCLQLMTEADKLGSIGGIFHLAFATNQSFIASQYLDEISRKMCPKLHYFIVFTSVTIARGIMSSQAIGNSTIEHIVKKRVADGFSGKAIQWNTIDKANLSLYINNLDLTLSCTEEDLLSTFVVNNSSVRLTPTSPMKVVAKELNIKDVKSISPNMTIGQMESKTVKLMQIKYALEKEFRIHLSLVDLQNIPLDDLQQICTENKKNLEIDLIEIAKSDKSILQTLCLMEKQPIPQSNKLVSLNDVAHGVPIIVFSGISGQKTKIWSRIGDSLNHPAFMYQYDNDESVQTLQDVVISAVETIKEFLNKKGTKSFNIIAYSLGSAVAHDTIVMLEKSGFLGKVIFIDSSKLLAAEIMHALAKTYTPADLLKSMLEIILHEFVPDVLLPTIELNMKFKFTNQIMMMAARDFLVEHNYKNSNELVLFIESVLTRLQTFYDLPKIMSFEPVDSEVLLIKASQVLLPGTDDYYGLEAITTRKVELETLNGDHKSIMQNEALPQIVNKYFK